MSHLVGQLRSFVALSAGMSRMKYRRFLGYEVVAAALWNTTFCVLGYLLASQVERLQMLIERAGWVLLGVFVLLFLAWHFVGQRIRQRMRQERREVRRRARSAALR
jgi:membrane protein DedA with SNARE-associated domain